MRAPLNGFHLISVGLLFLSGSGLALGANSGQLSPLFSSPTATEAHLSFDNEVRFENFGKPNDQTIEEKIEKQLSFAMGSMRAKNMMPKLDHKIDIVKLKRTGFLSKTWVIRYHYEGTVIVSREWTGKTLDFILPIDPDRIYEQGVVFVDGRFGKRATYPCTDPHYQAESEFWYFWNPSRSGCPLKEGPHYRTLHGQYARLGNTEGSLPEYARLSIPGETGPELRIRLLVGMNGGLLSENPFTSADENAPQYLEIRRRLLELGFNAQITSEDPFEEVLTLPTKKGFIRVTTFFGITGLQMFGRGFHYALKDGLENDSVLIYNGHSGLGASLNPEYLERYEGLKIQIPRDRYQIYLFNGCSTYSYYLSPFFERKKTAADPTGHQNLEVISMAKAVGADTFPASTLALLSAIVDWARDDRFVPYSEILKGMEHGSLVSVTGDEDNL